MSTQLRNAPEIVIIPPTPTITPMERKKKLRVAAYCRVSTEQDEQETSYQTQIVTYTNLINGNKDWELVDIYADEGITGTLMDKRNDFKRMMKDAMQGKIDKILTKSISRFARNTVDTLTCIQQLRKKNVDVYFEKERIHTMDQQQYDFLITILAGFAQEESRSISENVRWGKRKQMKIGNVHMPSKIYGYTKDGDEEFIIVEEEAKIIRQFYTWILQRYSFNEVKNMADEAGYRSRDGKKFTAASIKRIVLNEKYAGDYLAQKTYSKDFITKKSIINEGKLPKYYIKDHHKGIISHETRERVLQEIQRREYHSYSPRKGTQKKSYNGKHALSGRILCAHCRQGYNRKTWIKRDGSKQYMWKCSTRMSQGGIKYCSNSLNLDEVIMLKITKELFERIIKEYECTEIKLLNAFVERIRDDDAEKSNATAKIMNIRKGDDSGTQQQGLMEMIKQYELEDDQEIAFYQNQLFQYKEIIDDIGNCDLNVRENMDALIRNLINNITVNDAGMMEYNFFNGIHLKIRYGNDY